MKLSREAANRRRRIGLGVGVALVLLAAGLGLSMGAAEIPPSALFRELVDRLPLVTMDSGLSEREQAIIWQLRMPRVVLGALVGATLAAAGGAYQGVFRNPLADPYLLGVAAGAGLGATAAIIGSGSASFGLVAPAAFLGGLLAAALAWTFSRTGGGRGPVTLILAGVAVAAFLTAIQTYLQQSSGEVLREVYAWILGSLSQASWLEVVVVVPYVALAAAVLLVARRALDVMAVGDEEAATLGLRPQRTRAAVVVAATLGTAAVVSVSGLIGFVGIVVPHTLRLLTGASYRTILPLALLGGAAFLMLADVIARVAVSPGELPIGVVTAFVGAPFFAVVLRSFGRVS